jgi:HAD superfamily hydrolase (TIGR01490 family)
VFDLDGTITWHDTLVPYLLDVLRAHPSRILGLWRVPFALARFAVDRDRGPLKASLIRGVMGGLSRAEVARLTEAFLDRRLPHLTRPDALARIDAHRQQGDYLVLLSASTDFYVPAIGRRLGFAESRCTGVRWNGDRLDGRLSTPNHRDRQKTRCIEALRAEHPGKTVAAYGNSASDFDHLLAVDAPFVVNASATTRRRAHRLGLPVADWR